MRRTTGGILVGLTLASLPLLAQPAPTAKRSAADELKTGSEVERIRDGAAALSP